MEEKVDAAVFDAEYLKRTFHPSYVGKTPIYMQLANYYRMQLRAGVLKEGDRMIPEEEVCNALSISRSTVRQAMSALADEGILVRFRGKGTYIAKKKLNRALNQLYSFTDDMEALGVSPSSRTLCREVLDSVGDEVLEKLQLADARIKVFHLTRVRMADGVPMLYEDTYIPYYLCPGIEAYNFDETSLYKTLKNKYSIIPFSAVETLQGILIPKHLREIFNCKPNTVGYKIQRVARLDSDYAYEFTASVTRADLCSYQFQLNNTAASVARANSSIVFSAH